MRQSGAKGKIVVIVAPSGTGKSTLLQRLKAEMPELRWSVSLTTRPPRQGEVDGVDYHFVDVESFEESIEGNEFIEWAQVHQNYYGTLKSVVDKGLAEGYNLLFDLDIQGCDSMKEIYGDLAKVIFIEPPSVEDLELRLRKRNTDSTGVIEIRLSNAKRELSRKDDYDFNVVNDDIERAYLKLKQIVQSILKGS
ncbi:MAG: guanylate kinase [Halobacteriovoraceae bacterium]|nr:guanylate kinase [Halobacteriovoraceae bacterium]|tara:strand:- start:37989 stop:38570 length:582 start_codon:yes stop_codon:yes gene_type:complete